MDDQILDGRTAGLIGGIVGGVGGVLGGAVGTYFSIKNTNGPRERAFVIRAAIAMWLWMTACLACQYYSPAVWRPLVQCVTFLPLYFIKKWNDWQALARLADRAEVDAGDESPGATPA